MSKIIGKFICMEIIQIAHNQLDPDNPNCEESSAYPIIQILSTTDEKVYAFDAKDGDNLWSDNRRVCTTNDI